MKHGESCVEWQISIQGIPLSAFRKYFGKEKGALNSPRRSQQHTFINNSVTWMRRIQYFFDWSSPSFFKLHLVKPLPGEDQSKKYWILLIHVTLLLIHVCCCDLLGLLLYCPEIYMITKTILYWNAWEIIIGSIKVVKFGPCSEFFWDQQKNWSGSDDV